MDLNFENEEKVGNKVGEYKCYFEYKYYFVLNAWEQLIHFITIFLFLFWQSKGPFLSLFVINYPINTFKPNNS